MKNMELIKKYEVIYGAGTFESVFQSNENELRQTMEKLQSIVDNLRELMTKQEIFSPISSNQYPDFEDAIIECLESLDYYITDEHISIKKGEMHADQDGYPVIYAEITIEPLLKVKILMSASHHNKWDFYLDEICEFTL